MDTFRHTFFARLSLLLLLAVFLQAEAFADLEAEPYSAADGVVPECRLLPAAFDSPCPGTPCCGVSSDLLEAPDHLVVSHPAACLHRAPRLSRPLPDSGCCGCAAEGIRRTFRPDPPAVGRPLRAHYSLYCVYRI